MDATFYDSLGQPKNAVQSPEFMVGDELGYNVVTSNVSTGSIANATRSGTLQSITITGDGVSPVWVEWHCFAPYISAGTVPGHFNVELWDGTVGSGTLLQQSQYYGVNTTTSAGSGSLLYRMAPFTGTKTLNISVMNSVGGGSSTITLQAGATSPMVLRATKLKSAGSFPNPSCAVTAPLTSGDVAQVPTSADTQITKWQTELWDTHGMFTVNTNKITAPIAGIYQVDLTFTYNSGTTSTERNYCYVTRYNTAGTSQETILLGQSLWNTAAATTWVSGTQHVKMSAGDYLVASAAQFTGGTRTFQTSGGLSRFAVTYVGPGVEARGISGTTVTGGLSYNDTSGLSSSAGASTYLDGPTITVSGDGVTGMYVEVWGDIDAAGAGGVRIRDGSGTVLQDIYGAAARREGFFGAYYQIPFTGTKTFKLSLFNGAAGSYTVFGGSGNQHGIRARWA